MNPKTEQAEMALELRGKPARSFIETGWGRFPIALDDAGLHPLPFAVYVRLSICADKNPGETPTVEELAKLCLMTVEGVRESLEILQKRNLLTIVGDDWTLTDPTEWLP